MLQTHRGARVLIVDDYADTALLLQRLLARHGFEHLHVATDPRAVLDHLPELNPDLVLLDLYMPYVDGYTMLRHIRDWAGQEYLPVVVLTADVRPETLLRAINDGATDFLTKPFNATEILIRVRNLLHTRSLHLAVKDLAVNDLTAEDLVVKGIDRRRWASSQS
jgi:putative two-component system response regulator